MSPTTTAPLGKDLVGLEHMSSTQLKAILDTAEPFKEISERRIKKVPVLRGKTIVNLFFEASTRTRISFEFAEKRLSADTVNISSMGSSVTKGETLVDTARNLEAMRIDMVVMRHPASGSAQFLADRIPSNVVNAGDGRHEHPTQGLLDILTIRDHLGDVEGLKVCIVGDILHSRVARSNIYGLLALGAEVAVCGPPTLLPLATAELGVEVFTHIEDAIQWADALNVLRLQLERMEGGYVPSLREYNRIWGVTNARLEAAPRDLLVLHPGPMNRGVEIDSDVADGPHSVILNQVTNGVAVRMAVLYLLAGGQPESAEAAKGGEREMSGKVLLRGGRVVDPSQSLDATLDVLIAQEKVATVAAEIEAAEDARVVDCSGLVVTPGLIDVHVHLREPGEEHKETIATGAASAAAGGFTAVCAMPNTDPPIDDPAAVGFVAAEGRRAGAARVYPVGCISVGRAGQRLALVGEMVQAGAVAITDDGDPVMDSGLMRLALEYAQTFGIPVADHPEDIGLSIAGHMNEGLVSTRLGLPGKPNAAEDIHIVRDLLLAELTGGHIHLQHVSTSFGVEAIRQAKARGVHVTAEASPHHLVLTHEAVEGYRTEAKMNPPLRSPADVEAVRAGLADGSLDTIATDHAPHHYDEKEAAFADAPNGIVGLETALGVVLTRVVKDGVIDLPTMIDRMSCAPARAFRLPGGTLAVGSPGDVTVFDPSERWTVDPTEFRSKSRNTPFAGWELEGRPRLTVVGGRVVFER